MKKIILAKPRGFCAGVDRAIKVVELALEIYGKPVYVKHQIVHNKKVVSDLEKKGAVFVEDIEKVPEGSYLIFSAHGVPPSARKEAAERKLKVVDATCPLVTKVHLEAINYAKDGCTIILVGHKGHVELIGTAGEAAENTIIVETFEDIDNLEIKNPEKSAYLTQTTLSVDDTRQLVEYLKKKFPKIAAPPKDDICYATQNRQLAAKQLSKAADVVFVIGSKNSSNSNRLVDVVKAMGKPAHLIDGYSEIEEEWIENKEVIGITSGASAPEALVEELIGYLQKKGYNQVEELEAIQESISFVLPREMHAYE